MNPSELYEKIGILDSLDLLTFLNESKDVVRLVFLRAQPSNENTESFQAIVRVLAQKQLAVGLIATAEIQSLYTHLAFYFKKSFGE